MPVRPKTASNQFENLTIAGSTNADPYQVFGTAISDYM